MAIQSVLQPIIQPIIRPVIGLGLIRAPSTLTAAIDDTSGGIELTASSVSGADSYSYYYAIDGGAWQSLAAGQGTSYTFTPTQSGEYSFGVTAVKGSTESRKRTLVPDSLFDDVPNDEGIALMAFYEATGGDAWTTNTNWLTATTVGNWYGVTVSGGHVTEIELAGDDNLNGDGLSAISSLTTLTSFICYNNNLSGDISSIENLTNLTYLRFVNTDVTGDIVNLGDMTSLTSLYTSRFISGDIVHISGLTELITLMMTRAIIIGDIANLNSMTALEELSLDQTGVTGDIADLNTLTQLSGTAFYQGLKLEESNVDTYTSTTLPAWACNIDIADLSLSETEVDNFLADLDTAGGTGGVLDISGTNAAPSAAGETSVDNLRANSWTVTVTGGY